MKFVVWFLVLTLAGYAAPIISLDVDTLKFGHVSIGGHHERELLIRNIGDQPLIISDVDLTFVVFNLATPNLPDTILPSESSNYTIEFNPTVLDGYASDLVIASNDPVSPTTSLWFYGHATPVFEAGEIIWTFQAIENVVSCTAVDDIDGDGFEDVVAEAFDAGASGDNLTCHSGSGVETPELLWSARPLGGPSNSGGYGDQCLMAVDDLNRNSTRDIILGTAWGSRTVFGIEGATGETIWSYDTYANPPSGWIYGVGSMGDITGDTIPEIIAGAGSDANTGYCFNGASGALIWQEAVGDAVYSVCRLDDINDDGVPDAVLGSGDNDDRVYCISGASQGNATTIWSYATGGSVMSVDKIDDINGDGYDDVIAGTWYNGNRVFALSGHSSGSPTVLWNVPTPSSIMKAVVCPDLNNDGYQDVVIASWASFALALSGQTGAELWRYYFTDDVWAISWAYDVTGDGIGEIVAGSFTGDVALINGADGQGIWTRNTEAKLFTVRPIKDINGDGFADIIAGQQYLNNVGGKLFVISGGTVNPNAIDENAPLLPQDHILVRNYPNPFNSTTLIYYRLAEGARVALEIYDLTGKKIIKLVDQNLPAGEYSTAWGGKDSGGTAVASGVYFARIIADKYSQTAKMTLIK